MQELFVVYVKNHPDDEWKKETVFLSITFALLYITHSSGQRGYHAYKIEHEYVYDNRD